MVDPYFQEAVTRINKIKKIFMSESVLSDHYAGMETPDYIACLLVILYQGNYCFECC